MDQSILRLLIREKLVTGCLPHMDIPRIWNVPGNGETCDGCGGVVTLSQTLIEGELTACGCGIRFHVACFALWEAERQVPGQEPARSGAKRAPSDGFDTILPPGELLCPHCGSTDLVGLGRVFATKSGVEGLYRCRRCVMEMWLRTLDRRRGPRHGHWGARS